MLYVEGFPSSDINKKNFYLILSAIIFFGKFEDYLLRFKLSNIPDNLDS